jgi:signal transduction histidine kinase
VPVDGMELGTTLNPALKTQFELEREDGSVLVGDLPPQLVEHHAGLRSSGLRSWVEAPVGPAGEPFAYVSMRSKRQNAYTEQDLELLKAVALQIAPAFRNATLLEELEIRVAARTADLNASDAARTRMLATVSHELRNALAAVMGFDQVLLKNQTGNLTERQVQVLRSIESSTGQIESLAHDLTDFANIEVGQYKLEKKRADLAGMVIEVAASFAPAFTKKRQKNVVSGCDRPVELQADPDRVAQVLQNLIGNASKYSPEGTVITVSLEVSEGAARIAVRDQGIGISQEDQKHLFQSFFRANDPEVRAVSGTGLGLAVSKRLLELHEGGIGVVSTPGRGSVFTMWLPLEIMAGGVSRLRAGK